MNSIYNVCTLEEKNNFSSEYVGITFTNGNFNIVFPRGYKLSSNENQLKSDIMLLIKVFDKYVSKNKDRLYSKDILDLCSGKGKNFSITNAIWLLNDYATNGLYINRITNYKTSKNGTINWTKTINSIPPYISNNNLNYLDFIVKEKNNDLNNLILLIQKYIIKKCLDLLGWMFPSLYLYNYNDLPYSRQVCINLLKKEFRLINIDSTKRLLIHMIDFLENDGCDLNNLKFKEYKTKYFSFIWEDMLNEILGNDDPSKYFPQAIWNINAFDHKASNLRPDIILNKNSKMYVLDAKYYKYGVTNKISDLPQTSDINKQLLYSDHIKTLTRKISFDAFIIPYPSDNRNIFKFIGNASINTASFKNKKVVCILADTKTIMKKYIYGNNLDDLKNMVIEIIDNQNKDYLDKLKLSNINIKSFL